MRADRFEEMATFVKAVECGGFSAASRALNVSPSAVSKLISRLEARLGCRLLARSTRAISLTMEGESYFDQCIDILNRVEAAELCVGAKAEPLGRIRVNTSAPVGECLVVPHVAAFLSQHPKVSVDISLRDTVVDLLEEGIDVAIRAGPLSSSQLIGRKLLESRRIVVASPAYLRLHGAPTTPEELASHNCLQFNFRRAEQGWPFSKDGDVHRVLVDGSASAGDGQTLRGLAIQGVGLARLAEFHIAEDIRAGRLAPILQDYDAGDTEQIHALYVGGRTVPSRTKAFVDFLATKLTGNGGHAAARPHID
jgi:DNA-binding transcriptional LysR family regulator